MPLIIALLAAGTAASTPQACSRKHLSAGVAARRGTPDFAPVSGAILSISNHGPDCMLSALPTVTLQDVRGRRLPAVRRVPPGMHPGPAIIPILLPGGHRATFELTWPYCPTDGRCTQAHSLTATFGRSSLRIPVGSEIPAVPAKPFQFDQPPGRVAEGMASDLD